MSSSRKPSPARSQGSPVTRSKPCATRSVGSPARSASGRLSNIVDKFRENYRESFAVSPLNKTVTSDNTAIEIPRRRSWWRKVENSREMIEVPQNEEPVNPADVFEDFGMVVLSQEKDLTVELPESSGSESIHSIVVPQRKLFIQKENQPQKEFDAIAITSETTRPNVEDQTLHAGTKTLFGQTSKRTKPVFPSALLNMTNDNTLANKTKELPAEIKAQPRGLFGNRPGTKRKNMFADLVASESEDEISEVHPRRFTFNKPSEPTRRSSIASSITTDIELDDWKMLPSSTMVEHQLEAQLRTPGKKARLSKLSVAKECTNAETEQKIDVDEGKDQSVQAVNKGNHEKSKQHQLEPQITTPVRRANLSKLSVAKESTIAEAELKLDAQRTQSEHVINNEDHNKIEELKLEHQLTTPCKKASISKLSEAKECTAAEVGQELHVDEKREQSVHAVNNGKLNMSEEHQLKAQLTTTDETVCHNKLPEKSNIAEVEQKLNVNEEIEKSEPAVYKEGHDKTEELQLEAQLATPGKKAILSKILEATESTNTDDRQELNSEDEKKQSEQAVNVENIEEDQNKDVEEQVQNESQNHDEEENVDGDEEQEKCLENTELDEQAFDVSQEMAEENDEQDMNLEMSEERDEQEMMQAIAEDDEQKVSQDMAEGNEKEVSLKIAEDDEQEVGQEMAEDNELEVNTEVAEEVDKQREVAEDDEQEVNQGVTEDDAEQEVSQEMEEDNEQGVNTEVAEKDDKQREMTEGDEQEFNQDVTEKDHETEEDDEQEVSQEMEEEDGEQEMSQEMAEEDDEQEVSQELAEDDEQEISLEMEDENDEQEASEEMVEDDDQEESEEIVEDDNEQEIAEEDEEQNDSQELVEENEQKDSQEMDDEMIEASAEVQDEEHHQIDANITHDTTGRNRKKRETDTPEAILYDETNELNSFTAKGRNTSIRKTIPKYFAIRQSMASARESIGLSDGTKNSSAEGSGWDSHRTTRKTLRQTFGKDFTPRKSLRTLVMEKSAKRQTMINEANAELKRHQANSTDLPDDQGEMDYEDDVVESDHEISRRMRQANLEKYLQNYKKETMEMRQKIAEEMRNPIKLDILNRPNKLTICRAVKASQSAPRAAKTRRFKPLGISLENLPPELIEDMKYKPPKKFKPSNASWITKRLYKFLENKLEPKYDYKARIRAEKLVETIYNFTREMRRLKVSPPPAVAELKRELARLGVLQTHHEFYDFIREYLPYEVRIKVIPDIINKIPVPSDVFGAII